MRDLHHWISHHKNELRDSHYKRAQLRSIVLFILGVLIFTLIAGFLFRQSPTRPPVGRAATVSDFPSGVWFNTSEPISLYDQLKGHVVVVLFNDFNTLSDLEDMNRLAEVDSVFQDYSVVCIVVSAGVEHSQTATLVDQWSIEFPLLADPDSMAMAGFGISALPGVVVIDTASRVAARYYEDWQRAPLEDVIRDLLDQGIATRSLAVDKYIP